MRNLPPISPDQPVLIAGPTASGKSALALEIAETQGGVIVNADAIQVYENWRILTARPSEEDESRAPHALYGHIAHDAEYSVGHWLREVAPLLTGDQRPIITGGTGLYFTALTQGLADIPATPPEIRAEADARVAEDGFESLLAELDPETAARIDQLNPMRVQRAWEVLRATGQPLAAWQDNTPAPLLPEAACVPILFDVDKDWLNDRIARRFDLMIELGALEEARANLPIWNPKHLSAKAIGAPELMAHLNGELDLDTACERATIATRQFAKRQRTWFRSKMKTWARYRPDQAT
ncbi:tRNA (adenosine(37)-N6)-dimethylallyltransferase MiaA [Shimia sp. CNT1-13L.2]|uniref:tRNA (adenosine(37)-N6)-dimethylallyltransferase MiaA n=1 Tax=Shimia sp. CNT1-13L.2 TaxID=2959663 RepID=UPI0020CFB89B|nr:tRNA (adenosine(37)-N6)-dimethylallyltransferase MiaA [Shimia sp. CNT1-13L.2]MCP9482025.1 tRNA (adenosine(37)-N6)-dimethylallyltransferase MiaA [Shimia sp. CNT1-13L.2]